MPEALSSLDPLAREVLALRLGAGGSPRTNRETAERLGVHPRLVERVVEGLLWDLGREDWRALLRESWAQR